MSIDTTKPFLSKMGYARCDIKPNANGIKKLPTSWTTVPIDISEGRTVTFAFNYVWTQNNCTISNIEWYPTQLINGEWTSQNIAFDDTTDIDFFNQPNKIAIKFGGSSATISSDATLNSGNVTDSESETELTVNNISASYLSASFKYSYIVKYDDTTEKWVAAGSNDEAGEYSFIEYFIKIDNIRIAKISKYENNVVFTERGVNELLTNIKKYPIIDVTSVESNATDTANNNIWSYYTGGKPCVKIDYGDRGRTFEGYTTNGAQTTGYKYVAVGSNIKFKKPDGTDASSVTTSSTQNTGTFRVNIDGVTYEVPIKGFSADGTTLYVTNLGDSNTPISDAYITNLHLPAGTDDLAFDLKGGTTAQFLRGNGINKNPIWSNTLMGTLHINKATGSWYKSYSDAAIIIDNNAYTAWIAGDTKDGHIAITTYPSADSGNNKLYFGYLTSDHGSSPNSFDTSMTWDGASGDLTATRVFNAVFNDYAEYRATIDLTPGHVVIDQDDGSLACSFKRL